MVITSYNIHILICLLQYVSTVFELYITTENGFLSSIHHLVSVTYLWRIQNNRITVIGLSNLYLHIKNSTDNISLAIWNGFTHDLKDVPAMFKVDVADKYINDLKRKNIISSSPLIVYTCVPRSTMEIQYKQLPIRYTELQAPDVVNIVNTQPVLHQAYSINTLDHPVKVVVDVHHIDGMTGGGCSYGGYQFGHFYKYTRNQTGDIIVYTILYRDSKTDETPAGNNYGPYCTTSTAVPLLGKLNSLYLQTGVNVFVFYAFLPHFHLNLTLRLQNTECEGIINPSHTICIPSVSVVIAKRYKMICKTSREILPLADTCLVIQKLHPYEAELDKVLVTSGPGMNVSIYDYRDINIEYTNEVKTCTNSMVIHYTTINKAIGRHYLRIGSHVAGKLYNNLEILTLVNKDTCKLMPLINYHIQIYPSQKRFCPRNKLAGVQQHREDLVFEIFTKCLLLAAAVTSQFYVITVSLSLYDPRDALQLSYFYVYNRHSCGRGEWDVYVINYNLWKYILTYDFTRLERTTYFYRYGLVHDIGIELQYHRKCNLIIEFKQSNPPTHFRRGKIEYNERFQVGKTFLC